MLLRAPENGMLCTIMQNTCTLVDGLNLTQISPSLTPTDK